MSFSHNFPVRVPHHTHIYRVLNNEGNGFYRDKFYTLFPDPEDWWDWKELDERHPFVTRDIENLGLNIEDLRFGFESTFHLERWFPKFVLSEIYDKGGKIVKLCVPKRDVFFFKSQLVFYPENAKWVEDILY